MSVLESQPNRTTLDDIRQLTISGIWSNNQALVALLGLCPLLAVSYNTVNALTLGIATLIVITLSNTVVSLMRNYVSHDIRIPAFVAIIATLVTVTELVLKAWWHEMYLTLGIFIALIVTNCAILGRAESFASRNQPIYSFYDGFVTGLGFFFALAVLGAGRELIGTGALFADMHLLFGPGVDWQLRVFDHGLLLASLAPGAFIIFGFMIAGYRLLDRKLNGGKQ